MSAGKRATGGGIRAAGRSRDAWRREGHGGSIPMRPSVFLAGERAYKVKRAVKFPFLDYSTAAKRKAACEAELEVNRPFAPQLYRGVVAITREADGASRSAAKGEPVEWAVEMRRFDENATLDHLADRRKDRRGPGRRARARGRGGARRRAGGRGRAVDRRARATSSGRTMRRFARRRTCFRRATPQTLTRKSRAALDRMRPLLLRARQAGAGAARPRRPASRQHRADRRRPVPFDAVEFDPLIAAGDVLYDLAFLLMDLIERGLTDAANTVLNRYLAETPPRRGSRRARRTAAVHVAARRDPRQGDGGTAGRAQRTKRDAIAKAARTYFKLACGLIAPPAPKLVAVGGLSGTGKSVLARALAPHVMPAPGAVLLRSDVERKALFGVGRNRAAAGGSLQRGGRRARSTRRSCERRGASSRPAIRSSSMRSSPGPRSARRSRSPHRRRRFHGLFLTADLATRVARVGAAAAMPPMRMRGSAREQEAYDLGALDWTQGRRVRHAGGHAQACQGCACGVMHSAVSLPADNAS